MCHLCDYGTATIHPWCRLSNTAALGSSALLVPQGELDRVILWFDTAYVSPQMEPSQHHHTDSQKPVGFAGSLVARTPTTVLAFSQNPAAELTFPS